MRLEVFRQGAQEVEARIRIEKALTDPEKKAKLGEALAKKAQDVLDRRQLYMAVVKASGHFEAECPGRLAEELYLAASEVANKAGN